METKRQAIELAKEACVLWTGTSHKKSKQVSLQLIRIYGTVSVHLELRRDTDNAQILYKLLRDHGVSEDDIVNGFGLGKSGNRQKLFLTHPSLTFPLAALTGPGWDEVPGLS